MSIIKAVLATAILAMATLVLYINFSTQTSTYICKDPSAPVLSNDMMVTIEEYHPWAKLWNSASGKLSYDIPTQASGSYSYVLNNNDLQLYKKDNTLLEGSYSKVKNLFSFNNKNYTFKGECIALNGFCANNLTH